MAARMKQHHQDDVRKKINARQLLNFMAAYALTGCWRGRPVDAKDGASRVMAADRVLNYALPKLANVEFTGEVQKRFIAELPAMETSSQAWLERYAPKTIDVTPTKVTTKKGNGNGSSAT